MTPCLSEAGGGRTYGLDFDFVKCPPSTSTSTSTLTSPTSSPSSTISESSYSISTKKPRTPRKRPNQTYNEAATLLSAAYPSLFSTKNLKKPAKFTKPTTTTETNESSEQLLLPFRPYDNDTSSFLLQNKPSFQTGPNKVFSPQEKPCPCQSPGEVSSRAMSSHELDDDFDCESILDEQIGENIDSIMGSRVEDADGGASDHGGGEPASPRFGFGGRFCFRAGARALRHVDDGSWWNFPAVDILEISPGMRNAPAPAASVPAMENKNKKKKKKEKVEKPNAEVRDSNQGFLLKLNYEEVRNAWSNRGPPFADDWSSSGVPGNDVTARIDLFTENRGVREARVLRFKEKRHARLFSKKFIRYQVRKVNSDQRPRVKGRFVGRANSSSNAQR